MGSRQLVGPDAQVAGGDPDPVEPLGCLHDGRVAASPDFGEEPLDRGDQPRLEDRGRRPGEKACLLGGVELDPPANGENTHDRERSGSRDAEACAPRGDLPAARGLARRATLSP